jgi:hypothetical protein
MSVDRTWFVLRLMYKIRKQWRIKLHAKRCADLDQSVERYQRDAKVLNRCMSIYKIEGAKATWQQ